MQKLNESFSGKGDGDGTTDSFLEDGSEDLCSLSTTQRMNGFAASLAAGLLLMFLADKKRRRDLTLRACVAAKAEQKKLQLLFLQWSEHQKKLTNFIRTKAEPPIYYALAKPLEEDTTEVEQKKEQSV